MKFFLDITFIYHQDTKLQMHNQNSEIKTILKVDQSYQILFKN
jgi:hypothetical protein